MTRDELARTNNDYYERLERIATKLLATSTQHTLSVDEHAIHWALRTADALIGIIDGFRNCNNESS